MNKEIERKLNKVRKEKERKERRKKRKLPAPSYKGYNFRNWLVWPLGVISVELSLAQDRKYKALTFTEEKAEEIINKYLVDVCSYDTETGELSFCTGWYMPWAHYAKKRDKLWCKKFNKELNNYLFDKYECPGFTKVTDEDPCAWDEWCVFTKQ